MIGDIMLSDNFALSQFTLSDWAVRHNVPIEVEVGGAIFLCLRALCERVLEPIGRHFGYTNIHITSGYRPAEVNLGVGGAATSQHVLGEAADFIVRGTPVHTVAKWVRDSTIPFDQLIWEFDAWTHVSYPRAHEPRHSILTARHTIPVYTQGIA